MIHRSRENTHGRSHWRWVRRVTLIVIVFGFAAAAWIGVRGWQARSALTAAIPEVQQLQKEVLAGNKTSALSTLARLQAHTQRGRDLTSDPVWRVAAHTPWAGRNLRAMITVARTIDDLADQVMPPVVESASALDISRLRPVDGQVDLDPLIAVAPLVAQAADAATRIASPIASIDAGRLVDVVARPVEMVQSRVAALALTLRTGQRATELLPSMLGADGPRRYLLLLQTNAELRATGGLPGVLCVVTADHGSVAITEEVSAGAMPQYLEPVVVLKPEDQALFTDRLGIYMGDVNLTPDFPTAAQIAAEMWLRYRSEHVDGVVATDPVALSYLLEATGPVDDGTGGQITANNAVDVLLSGAYARFPDPVDQNTFFAGVATNVFDAVVTGHGSPGSTVSALGRAAGERRLLVWSSHPDERQELSGTVLAGTMPITPTDAETEVPSVVGVFFNDATGAKMDYYLDTSVSLDSTQCTDGETIRTLRVTLDSQAPLNAATSLPGSVTGPGTYGVPKGSIGTNVVIVGSLGGQIISITRDGNLLGFSHDQQDGRPAATVTVELLPGGSSVLEFTITDPNPDKSLQIWTTPTRNQPGIVQDVTSGSARC